MTTMTNQGRLIGRIGKVSFDEQSKVVRILILTDSGRENDPDMHFVKAFDKTAQRFLDEPKGALVDVACHINSHWYKDQLGQDHYSVDIIADTFLNLESKATLKYRQEKEISVN